MHRHIDRPAPSSYGASTICNSRRMSAAIVAVAEDASRRQRIRSSRRSSTVALALLAMVLLTSRMTLGFTVEHEKKGRLPLSSITADRLLGRIATTPLFMAESPPEADDEQEWNAVLAAFKMYKAAYGDLKVPRRFVVPNIRPWPQQSWGLKLGKVVQAIRTTGRYIKNNSGRRQQLDSMEFLYTVRQRDDKGGGKIQMQQVVTAVQSYRAINGNVDIADTFIVPETEDYPESVRGLPLGKQLEVVKKSTNENVRQALIALGVQQATAPEPTVAEEEPVAVEQPTETAATASLDQETIETQKSKESPESFDEIFRKATSGPDGKVSANDERFKNVHTALSTYKTLYGDLLVPQPFIVPSQSKDWPEEVWGLRLGARVNAIRSQGTFVNNNPARREILNRLDFVWSPPKERRGRKPASADTDSSPFGQPGSGGALDSLFEDLMDFDKEFGSPPSGEPAQNSPEWDLESAILPDVAVKAVEQEATLKEDEYKPERTFEESLEEATQRALECGIIEGVQPNKRVIKGKREKNIPWFNDDFGDEFVFEDVVEALKSYKSIYGDFSNFTRGCDFVVPAPEQVTGFLDDESLDFFGADSSSRAASAIASFEDDSQVDSIAAEIQRLQQEVEKQAEEELQTATQTATETSAEKWAEHLAGMELGSIVNRIRDGSLEVKHIPERKEQLDTIGFDWGDPKYFIDIPFEKAMCAMYAYYLVRGDMFVYEDFIMPDEDPWPQALAGYELGQAVKRIRQLQNFFEAYHPEKVSLLRMIDFAWFEQTMALPLDPDEKEMTPETLMLSAFGHPDYSKLLDMPMGLADKIHSDGPFFETDGDPKLWWRKWHNYEYVKDYWYQQGRRDNAFFLRSNGYPKMADEHEAKYGPGLFSQLEELLEELETVKLQDRSPEEKQELLPKLQFFREELVDCTDLHPKLDRDPLLDEIDAHISLILEDGKVDMAFTDERKSEEFEYENLNGETVAEVEEEELEGFEEGEEYEEETEAPQEEKLDIEDELGLGGQR